MAAELAASAACAVRSLVVTPVEMVAMSGVAVTLPSPETEMVRVPALSSSMARAAGTTRQSRAAKAKGDRRSGGRLGVFMMEGRYAGKGAVSGEEMVDEAGVSVATRRDEANDHGEALCEICESSLEIDFFERSAGMTNRFEFANAFGSIGKRFVEGFAGEERDIGAFGAFVDGDRSLFDFLKLETGCTKVPIGGAREFSSFFARVGVVSEDQFASKGIRFQFIKEIGHLAFGGFATGRGGKGGIERLFSEDGGDGFPH